MQVGHVTGTGARQQVRLPLKRSNPRQSLPTLAFDLCAFDGDADGGPSNNSQIWREGESCLKHDRNATFTRSGSRKFLGGVREKEGAETAPVLFIL